MVKLSTIIYTLIVIFLSYSPANSQSLASHIADTNLHHNKLHATTHSKNGEDEVNIENLGSDCTSGYVVKADGSGGLSCSADNGDAALSYITYSSESGLSAEKVLGTGVIIRGAISARPAASTAGVLYNASDDAVSGGNTGLKLYRDNGSSWDIVYTAAGFIQANNSALACGASTAGEIATTATTIQFCDNAGTPGQRYVALGNSSGESTAAANTSVTLTTDVTGILPVANGGTATSTAFTTGSVVFATTAGAYLQDNSNFFWDDTNNRLGLGTPSPSYTLDVNGIANIKKLLLPSGAGLTISSGAITVTNSRHDVDTEAAAATDDLDNINGGTAGQILFIRTTNSTRDIVVRDTSVGGGNLRLVGSANFTLTDTDDVIGFITYDGTTWFEIFRGDIS